MIYKVKMQKYISKIITAICICLFSINAHANVPITTDSRIKTFVYNENEVFKLDFQYGYQSNIEFGLKEDFETISVGNSNSWKITPVGRRIFIKPLDGDSKTNMTVITNKHVYHFDLHSHYPGRYLDNNLVYVVRFFHPQKNNNINHRGGHAKPSASNFGSQSMSQNNFSRPASSTRNSFAATSEQKMTPYNYNYTMSGPEQISPIQIFDDGSKTFFMFPESSVKPAFYYRSASGSDLPLKDYKMGKYTIVDKVANRFILKNNGSQVNIYKESN